MHGRLPGRAGRTRGGEAEALVRERLQAILAASAAPRPGWVPESSIENQGPGDAPGPAGGGPPVAWPAIAEPASPEAADEPELTAPDESSEVAQAAGRHRGTADSSRRVRWDPGRPGAVALCLAAVVAALVAAGLSWLARPEPSTVDQVTATNAATAGTAATGPSSDVVDTSGDADSGSADSGAQRQTAPGPSPAEDPLVVSVIGQVRAPGLVSVTEGARVADAIDAAGGALPEADLSTVNLARLVVDGEQIAVGIPGSSVPGGSGPGDAAQPGAAVDLNTAAAADLEELPGIGPVLAQRIIDFREHNGGFSAVEQLREVSGIGPAIYEGIVELVSV